MAARPMTAYRDLVIETGGVRWEPCDWREVKAGDRVAPLSTWTLDVIEVNEDGSWEALNFDTGRVEHFDNRHGWNHLHRLVRR